MPSTAFLVLLLLPLFRCAPVTLDDAAEYLQKYGYIQPARLMANSAEEEDPEVEERNAIKKFQLMAGIAQTGEIDDKTLAKMSAPRCGMPDFASYTDGDEAEWKWDKKDITYSIDNTLRGFSKDQTRNAVRTAFAAYSAVTPLKFTEVSSGEGDMKLMFARGRHGCSGQFDGEDGTLAHAYYPEDGRIHFDADESWTVMNSQNLPVRTHKDFLGVAIHEIGHALGLDHIENNPASIMAPIYNPPRDKNGNYEAPKLERALVKTLQNKYGTPTAPTGNGGGNKHNRDCMNHVYAAMNLPKNRIILFPEKGTRMVVFSTTTKRAIMNVPMSDVFSSGPSFATAGYFNEKDSHFMLFQGNQIWRYRFNPENGRVTFSHGYPKRLPGVGNDWHTGAAMYSHPQRIIVNYKKMVGFYDEVNHSMRLGGHLSTEYPNMPEFVAGFADIEGNGRHVGFTEFNVFDYNYKDKTSQHLGAIKDFLMC